MPVRILCLAVTLAMAAGCSKSDSSPSNTGGSTGSTGGSSTSAVAIPSGAMSLGSMAFGANPLTIAAGTTVTWTNNDGVTHTSTSVPGGSTWSSGNILPGATFSFPFTTPGTYSYRCNLHTSMTGTIVVN